MARPRPHRIAPEQRWITLEDAAERLPMHRRRAVQLLRNRGLIHPITFTDPETKQSTTYEAVWLPELARVHDEAAAADRADEALAQTPAPQGIVALPLPRSHRG